LVAPIATKTLPSPPPILFARPAEQVALKFNGYPEGDAKQLHQTLLLLKRSRCLNISAFCREAGATGGTQVKTITIRLPDVEAAMLVELQKVNRAYRDLQGLLISQIQQEYAKTPAARAKRQA